MRPFLLLLSLVSLPFLVCPAIAQPETTDEPTWYASAPWLIRNEPVVFTFHNTTVESVDLSYGDWSVVDGVGGLVYTATMIDTVVTVPPDSSCAFVWDQLDDLGHVAAAGLYEAQVEWSFSGEIIVNTSVSSFEIAPGPYLQTSVIGVPGSESLEVILVNDTLDDLQFDDEEPWVFTNILAPDTVVYDPPDVPAAITVPPGTVWTWNIDLTLLDIYEPGGAYDVWVRFLRDTYDDPQGLRKRFAFGGAYGRLIWRAIPLVNTTRSRELLWFANMTNEVREIASTAPWWIEDVAGNYVDSEIACQVIIPVPPGGSMLWSWDEQDWNDEWVLPGWYIANILCWLDDNVEMMPTRMNLYEPALEPCVWVRTNHWYYNQGDPVNFTFVNCAPRKVGMRAIYTWWISSSTGVPVYAPFVLWALTSFESGEGFSQTWNQIGYGGGQVPPGSYHVVVQYTDEFYATNWAVASAPFWIGISSDVPDRNSIAVLEDIHPNPFNPQTTIRFELQAPSTIDLEVYDPLGRLVRVLMRSENCEPGHHEMEWDGRDDVGRSVSGGVYVVRLVAGLEADVGRMVLLK